MAFGTESVLVLALALAFGLASAVEFEDGIAMVAVAVVGGGGAEEVVVATRSQEGHIVRVVAGSCM